MMKATFAQCTKRWCVRLIAWYTAPNTIFCLILAITCKCICTQLQFLVVFVAIQSVWVVTWRWTRTDYVLWVWGIWHIFSSQIRAFLFIAWNTAYACIQLVCDTSAASPILIWTDLLITQFDTQKSITRFFEMNFMSTFIICSKIRKGENEDIHTNY